jgi:hypothetical protein
MQGVLSQSQMQVPVRWQEELVDEKRKHVVRFYPQVDGVGL